MPGQRSLNADVGAAPWIRWWHLRCAFCDWSEIISDHAAEASEAPLGACPYCANKVQANRVGSDYAEKHWYLLTED